MAARATAQRVSSRVPATGSAAPIKKARPQAAATSLDRLLHDPMRLGIASALAAGGEMSFTDLKSALGATDGNLSSNISTLEQLGYVRVKKRFIAKTTNTSYSITKVGRKAFQDHLDALESIIRGVTPNVEK